MAKSNLQPISSWVKTRGSRLAFLGTGRSAEIDIEDAFPFQIFVKASQGHRFADGTGLFQLAFPPSRTEGNR
jgi:hypothetical protein